MSLASVDGPLEEKYATTGAGLYFVTVTVASIVPTGFLRRNQQAKLVLNATII